MTQRKRERQKERDHCGNGKTYFQEYVCKCFFFSNITSICIPPAMHLPFSASSHFVLITCELTNIAIGPQFGRFTQIIISHLHPVVSSHAAHSRVILFAKVFRYSTLGFIQPYQYNGVSFCCSRH